MLAERLPKYQGNGIPTPNDELVVPITLKVRLKINPRVFIKPAASVKENLHVHLDTNINLSPKVQATQPNYFVENGHLQVKSSPTDTENAANFNIPVDVSPQADYEQKIHHLTIQIGELEIATERERKKVSALSTEQEKKLEELRELHRQEICSLATQPYASFEQNISYIHRKHALELNTVKAEHERQIRAFNEVIDRLQTQKKLLLRASI
ncbi:MAG: hypothetical protein VKK42_03980 [Lyngbya sp.]|nr:hypothetical protein [Lyngbya sp.]